MCRPGGWLIAAVAMSMACAGCGRSATDSKNMITWRRLSAEIAAAEPAGQGGFWPSSAELAMYPYC